MIKIRLRECPLMGNCSIKFKNCLNCFTGKRLKCAEFKKLCKTEWNKAVETNQRKIRDSKRSYNFYFTIYYIIVF